jgi:serine/threonine-protein kinase
MTLAAASGAERSIGRYAICGEIAAGGMATVHVGRLLGSVGFSRIVAIKALHPQYAKDPDFLSMLLDEARLAGRINHPNVVSVLDVVSRGGELYLVMDYVQGESLSRLVRRAIALGERVPVPIALAALIGALDGLHAAHEARDEHGEPLGIVHRDVSPQNILLGVDGAARILDFGIAKAASRTQTTRSDQLKGKLAYMAPEQLERGAVDRGVDIYAASIVLWELLTGRRLFQADDEVATFQLALQAQIPIPSSVRGELPVSLDPIVLQGLMRSRADRYPTARAMARALEDTGLAASPREVGAWVERLAADWLESRAATIANVERSKPEDALDSTQARQDASLLRKIDRRALAEADTSVDGISRVARVTARATSATARSIRSSARRFVWFALSAVGFVGIGLVFVHQRAPAAARADAPAAIVATESPIPPSIARSEPAPLALTSSETPAPEPASAEPASKPAYAEPHRALASRNAKPATPSSKPKTDCSNPFTIDEHGVRIPKRQCL